MSAESLPKTAELIARIKALNDARRVWHARAMKLFRRAAWLSQLARMVPEGVSNRLRAKAAARAEEARAARAEATALMAKIEAV